MWYNCICSKNESNINMPDNFIYLIKNTGRWNLCQTGFKYFALQLCFDIIQHIISLHKWWAVSSHFIIWYTRVFFPKKRGSKWRYSVDRKHRKMLLVSHRVSVICIKIMLWYVLLYENKLILDHKFDMLKTNN